MVAPRRRCPCRVAALGLFAALLACGAQAAASKVKDGAIRIGYFYGGRCYQLYRASHFGFFDQEGVPVQLYSAFGKDAERFVPLPNDFQKMWNMGKSMGLGRTSGTAIIKAMQDGVLDAGCVGETSFIEAVHQGKPIVAVLQLSHGMKDAPGHVILLRKGLKVSSSRDLVGKTLLTRRAGPADGVFLKEYLRQEGLVPGKDVAVIEQVPFKAQYDRLKDGTADGGLYHAFAIQKIVEDGDAYIFRRMDWINPELSNAVLVFQKDFLKRRSDDVRRIVRAYAKRVLYEKNLPPEEMSGAKFGMITDITGRWAGVGLPGASYPPRIDRGVLNLMQELFVRHGALKRSADLSPAIDQSLLEEYVRTGEIP